MKLFSKESAGIATMAGTVAAAEYTVPGAIGSTLSYSSGAVNGILAGTGELIESATEPVIGSLAPTAAPMVAPTIAGAYLGKKIGTYLFDENSVWKKRAATVTGGVIGATLSTSAAAPYIVGTAALYAGRKIPLWASKKMGQTAGAIWGATGGLAWGGVKGAGKGFLNSTKAGWEKPSLRPQIGF